MRWPPIKSWTSTSIREGFRHFVAINYGGKGKDRWVSMVAVLDGNSRLMVSWNEIKDNSKWNSGWLKLSRDQSNPSLDRSSSIGLSNTKKNGPCLHPSEDSGLLIPSEAISERPWL